MPIKIKIENLIATNQIVQRGEEDLNDLINEKIE